MAKGFKSLLTTASELVAIQSIGYAGTYAFATVLCAIAGSIMARL